VTLTVTGTSKNFWKNINPSPYPKFQAISNLKVDFYNLQILTSSPDKYKLLILESIFIQQQQPDFNLDSASYRFRLFNIWLIFVFFTQFYSQMA